MKTKLLPFGIGLVIGTVGPMLAGAFVNGAIFVCSAVKLFPPDVAEADVAAGLAEPDAEPPAELALEPAFELGLELPHAATNSASATATAKPGPRRRLNDRIITSPHSRTLGCDTPSSNGARRSAPLQHHGT
jgi:hypothetical protein